MGSVQEAERIDMSSLVLEAEMQVQTGSIWGFPEMVLQPTVPACMFQRGQTQLLHTFSMVWLFANGGEGERV